MKRVAAVLAIVLACTPANAQNDGARAAWERGTALFEAGQLEGALAEFLHSRSLHPTTGNTHDAAIALRELGRHDEAMTMFETLLREFPQLAADRRKSVTQELERLHENIGYVVVQTAEPNARVFVAGRERGRTPLSTPLRMRVGTHLVRIVKSGFVPIAKSITVTRHGQVSVPGRLVPLSKTGVLRVTSDVAGATVLIDNVPTGITPWQGELRPGTHSVALRGQGNLGSEPAPAVVAADQTTSLALRLAALDCDLSIAPQPANASVALNGVSLGMGTWRGRTTCTPHRIEVSANDFITETRTVELALGQPKVETIELERNPDSETFRKSHPPRIVLDFALAWALSPSFGGDVAGGCNGACSETVPMGGSASLVGGYQWASGLGVGLQLGYLALRSKVSDRVLLASVVPNGGALLTNVSDELVLQAGFAGLSSWFRRGADVTWTARLTGGVALGRMLAERQAMAGDESVQRVPNQLRPAFFGYLAPELRAGLVVSAGVTLDLLVGAKLLFAVNPPSWAPRDDTLVASEGLIDLPAESLTSSVVFVLSPGLGGSFAFL